MLQVVIFPVDHVDGVPAQTVLGILALQNGLHGAEFLPGPVLHSLQMVGIQDHHAAQIGKGTDVVDLAGIPPAEWGALDIEAEVADGEHADSHDDGGYQLLGRNHQTFFSGAAPPLQQGHDQKNTAIHQQQQAIALPPDCPV